MLKVTETAKTKIKEVMESENKSDAYIRIYLSGMG